ncbi:hypothetical protein [Streptomyces sp. NPDC052036]|uniref:hypothetical protein n=1 Tax=unclassified Streptomyces TaxID=2593676 RepID=UPI00341E3A0B
MPCADTDGLPEKAERRWRRILRRERRLARRRELRLFSAAQRKSLRLLVEGKKDPLSAPTRTTPSSSSGTPPSALI